VNVMEELYTGVSCMFVMVVILTLLRCSFSLPSTSTPTSLSGISGLNTHWRSTCNIDSLWIAHVPGIWEIDQWRYNNPHGAPVDESQATTEEGSARDAGSQNSASNSEFASKSTSASASTSPRAASASGKFGNRQSKAYTHVQTLRSRVNEISMSNLRKALIAVDVSRCVEKADWRAMLVAKIIFGDKPKQFAIGDDKLKKLYYPDWLLKLKDGKATYLHALKEAARTYITKHELTTIQWRFQFKQAQDEQGNVFPTESLPEGSVRTYASNFFDDYTMTSESHQQIMNWTMQTNVGNAGPLEVTIQVENYPTLRFSKLKDGRWRIDNEYVFFFQSPSSDIGRNLSLI